MRKFLTLFAIFAMLFSCSDSPETKKQPFLFKNSKDKTSYVLGAINASTISRSGQSTFENLDKEQLIKGFNMNLNAKDTKGCKESMQKLFGPTYQDFNKRYLKEGCLSMGRLAGSAFYEDIMKLGGLDLVNFEYVKKGFADGLYKRDTLVSKQEMQQIMQQFITDMNSANGIRMMENAKKIKGAQVFENGIVLETIKAGSGGFPGAKDDVKVHYVLMNAAGDTIQDSKKMNLKNGKVEPVPLQLDGGVIAGWSFVLPKMRKGGTYRTYIPWELAYGEEGGKESLCFVIDLVDYAPAGTFVKP